MKNKKRLTKENIVNEVYGDTCYSHRVIDTVVTSTLNNIMLLLSQGYTIHLSGFGNFEPKERAARVGRNPRTNEVVPIPPRVEPVFKPGKALKDAVRKRVN